MNIIKRTPNGQLFQCPCQNNYNLEFGNILIHIDSRELEKFADYIYSIDYKYYLKINIKSPNQRKILLNVKSKNVLFTLNEFEFLELRELLSVVTNSKVIRLAKIVNNINLN